MLARHCHSVLRSISSASRDLPDIENYASLLRSCKNLARGKQLHAHLGTFEADTSTYLGNLLVNMYGSCGSVSDAQAAFDRIEETNVYSWNILVAAYAQAGHMAEARQIFEAAPARNVVTWNTVMTGYAQQGYSDVTVELFERFLDSGIRPTGVTFLAALEACSAPGLLETGRRIHDKIARLGLAAEVKIQTALVNMYAKCGSLELAVEVYREIPDEAKVVEVRNAMLSGYAQNGHVDEARRVFDEMEERSLVSWNAMVAGYAQNGHSAEALRFFHAMLLDGGVKPSSVTIASVLEACTTASRARRLHSLISESSNLLDDLRVVTALTNAYGRCGLPGEAQELFNGSSSRDVVLWTTMITAYAQNGYITQARELFEEAPSKNVVSWTTMITGYAQAGYPREALQMLRRMDVEGVQPNRVTLVCVIEACSDVAALAEGKMVYSEIAGYGDRMDTVVANALLNLHGKCGCVAEAWEVFANLRERSTTSWTAMITTYAQNGHPLRALELLKQMVVEGFAPNEITYVSVLSACGHVGDLRRACENFAIMVGDFGVEPAHYHYMCVMDALGRAGQLCRAEELLHSMPFEPDDIACSSILGACGVHSDRSTAARIAGIAGQDDDFAASSVPYVLLSNLFGCDERVGSAMRAAPV
ncbi:pentatricopeptide repeat-containing protein At2g13600-like [Selaginella moellendorffii]|uniref:pentatricopeptide repeat-containing protein At2g13600-like n=1 Tax=Selaginella moellendorffii TaxID=88036 RepID=UPI000D1CF388|nr:pentatricopeptide repeat-containing protein At2g13600-like [Selaginella moellendorffii]|eukprot:XP_024545270.1 pentatricopeptide repeat-containing protein At2g13600-like [Selaginella moellendorffii]